MRFVAQTLRPSLAVLSALLSLHCGAPVEEEGGSSSPPATMTPTPVPEVALSVSPANLSFGDVQQGDSKELAVKLKNDGDVAITLLYPNVQGTNSGWFTTSAFGGTVVQAGATYEVKVTFAPLAQSSADAAITFVTEPAEAQVTVQSTGKGSCVDGDGDDFCVDQGDCDDTDVTINPDRYEVCDGKDNDCNGAIDDNADDADTYYRDGDEDGYGNPITSQTGCEPPPGRGWVTNSGDCDDSDPTVNPDAPEICDGLDNNCNLRADEAVDVDQDGSNDCLDDDLDGYCEDPAYCTGDASPGDCDDTNNDNYPGGADIPDSQDNDCNGIVDDNTPPSIEFTSPAPGTVVEPDSLVTLVVNANDLQDNYFGIPLLVTITEGALGEVCEGETLSNGEFTCDVFLPYGQYTFEASTEDSQGEGASAGLTMAADNPPYVEQIVYPSENMEVPFGESVPFNAIVKDPDSASDPGGKITFVWTSDRLGEVYSGEVVGGLASAQIALNLEGPHLMTITATDSLGGQGSASVTILVGEPDCSPTRDLVALFHMDEGGGSTLADSSGNGLSGEVNATQWTSGKFGSGLEFNGVDSFVAVANTDGLLSLDTFTLDAWVKFTVAAPAPVAAQPILYKNVSDTSASENYDLRISQNGKAAIKVEKSGVPATETTAAGATTVTRDEWHLVTATYDGSNLRIYFNGQLDGSNVISGVTLQQGEAPLYFGTDRFQTPPTPQTQLRTLTGVMDEVRILNCSLSAGQIQAAYSSGSPFMDADGSGESTPTPEPTAAR